MRITANTTVAQLIDEHPEAEEILAWHGIDILDLDGESPISQVCLAHRKDTNELINDLESLLSEDDHDEGDYDDDL